jgi:hypothetical protein
MKGKQMNQIIKNQVIETFNNSGKKSAKQVFKLLLQIHDIDKKTAKELSLSLSAYIS